MKIRYKLKLKNDSISLLIKIMTDCKTVIIHEPMECNDLILNSQFDLVYFKFKCFFQ